LKFGILAERDLDALTQVVAVGMAEADTVPNLLRRVIRVVPDHLMERLVQQHGLRRFFVPEQVWRKPVQRGKLASESTLGCVYPPPAAQMPILKVGH
jgi:hypothetical protein